MRLRTTLLVGLLLTHPAMAKELDSNSTGADYMKASEAEQESYAFFIAGRLNKSSADFAVQGQDLDGCLRGMLIEFEEGQEKSHARLARMRLEELAVRCGVEVNQAVAP